MESLKIKVCGNTRVEDVIAADEYGADMVGVVVEVASSKRSVSASKAKELLGAARHSERAMLLFDPTLKRLKELVGEVKPDIAHFIGEEAPSLIRDLKSYFGGKIFKSFHLPPSENSNGSAGIDETVGRAISIIRDYEKSGADAIVLDTRDVARGLYGGTGKVSDWSVAREIVSASPLPVLLAGGINVENVAAAIKNVRPYGLDLASGLESEIGKKDHALMKSFIEKVKNATLHHPS